MAPTLKLTYFGIEGVAEKVRLALHLAGIDFEDHRISFEEWGTLKATSKFGQLPMLEIDGKDVVAQSGAMLRYVGTLGKLYPEEPLLRLKVEEVIGLEEDIGRLITPSMYVARAPESYGHPADLPEAERTRLQQELRKKLLEPSQLPRMLGYLDGLLAANGSGWFVGSAPTIADCQVIQRLRHLSKGVLDGIPATIVADFPNLKAFYDRFHELPQVKAYYEKLAAK